MTILEVAIALTVLLIAVGFIMQTDAVSLKHAYKSKVREQMVFYASGILEAKIEGVTPVVSNPAFADFEKSITTVEVNPHLEKIEVKVYLRNSPTNPEPVVLSTYRVKN